MTYFLHLVVMLGIYLMLALSANLMVGYGGLLTLAQAAFMGFGAYAFAILSVTCEWPTCLALAGSILVCAIMGLVFSFVLRRFRGETFAVATIAFQMVAFGAFQNWTDLTGGSYGFADIPRISAFGMVADHPVVFAILTVLAAIFTVVVMHLFSRTKQALSLRALRDDENAAAALGHASERMHALAIVLAASLAAIPGSWFASYVTYVDPSGFSIGESVFILSMLVVGGSGNLRGPVVGAIFMVLLPEILRFLGVPDEMAGCVREIAYGALLVVFMYFRPRGFCGDYAVR